MDNIDVHGTRIGLQANPSTMYIDCNACELLRKLTCIAITNTFIVDFVNNESVSKAYPLKLRSTILSVTLSKRYTINHSTQSTIEKYSIKQQTMTIRLSHSNQIVIKESQSKRNAIKNHTHRYILNLNQCPNTTSQVKHTSINQCVATIRDAKSHLLQLLQYMY